MQFKCIQKFPATEKVVLRLFIVIFALWRIDGDLIFADLSIRILIKKPFLMKD